MPIKLKKQPTKPARLRKQKLALELGISRTKLDDILGRQGAPSADAAKTFDVQEVALFAGRHLQRTGAGNDYRSLRERKLGMECELLAHKLAVNRGEYVEKKEIVPTVAKLWSELHALTRQKFEFELPPQYPGRNAIECAQLNIAALTAIDARFKVGAPK